MTRLAAGRDIFGHLPCGDAVDVVTLVNSTGMSARILTYGAALQSVVVPGRNDVFADVTLGHATLAEYLSYPHYAGATVIRLVVKAQDI